MPICQACRYSYADGSTCPKCGSTALRTMLGQGLSHALANGRDETNADGSAAAQEPGDTSMQGNAGATPVGVPEMKCEPPGSHAAPESIRVWTLPEIKAEAAAYPPPPHPQAMPYPAATREAVQLLKHADKLIKAVSGDKHIDHSDLLRRFSYCLNAKQIRVLLDILINGGFVSPKLREGGMAYTWIQGTHQEAARYCRERVAGPDTGPPAATAPCIARANALRAGKPPSIPPLPDPLPVDDAGENGETMHDPEDSAQLDEEQQGALDILLGNHESSGKPRTDAPVKPEPDADENSEDAETAHDDPGGAILAALARALRDRDGLDVKTRLNSIEFELETSGLKIDCSVQLESSGGQYQLKLEAVLPSANVEGAWDLLVLYGRETLSSAIAIVDPSERPAYAVRRTVSLADDHTGHVSTIVRQFLEEVGRAAGVVSNQR